jgi:hypothetical protein
MRAGEGLGLTRAAVELHLGDQRRGSLAARGSVRDSRPSRATAATHRSRPRAGHRRQPGPASPHSTPGRVSTRSGNRLRATGGFYGVNSRPSWTGADRSEWRRPLVDHTTGGRVCLSVGHAAGWGCVPAVDSRCRATSMRTTSMRMTSFGHPRPSRSWARPRPARGHGQHRGERLRACADRRPHRRGDPPAREVGRSSSMCSSRGAVP